MKKFLISILPLLVMLFVFVWSVSELKDALMFFGGFLLIVFVAGMLIKWLELVDEHIKD